MKFLSCKKINSKRLRVYDEFEVFYSEKLKERYYNSTTNATKCSCRTCGWWIQQTELLLSQDTYTNDRTEISVIKAPILGAQWTRETSIMRIGSLNKCFIRIIRNLLLLIRRYTSALINDTCIYIRIYRYGWNKAANLCAQQYCEINIIDIP